MVNYIFSSAAVWIEIKICLILILSTLNYYLDDLQTAITIKTKLLMVVNLLGNPNEFNRIQEIIGGKDIIMVEDNCESLGAEV